MITKTLCVHGLRTGTIAINIVDESCECLQRDGWIILLKCGSKKNAEEVKDAILHRRDTLYVSSVEINAGREFDFEIEIIVSNPTL